MTYHPGDYVRLRPNAPTVSFVYQNEVVRIAGATRDGRSPSGHYLVVTTHDGLQMYFLPDEVLPATEEEFLIDRLSR